MLIPQELQLSLVYRLKGAQFENLGELGRL
jgi:hypothetical protein